MLDKKFLYSAYRLTTQHVGPDGSMKTVHGTCFHVKAEGQIFIVTNRHIFELSYKDQKYVGYQFSGLQMGGYSSDDDYFEFVFDGYGPQVAVPDNPAEDVLVLKVPTGPMKFRRRRKPGEDPDKRTDKFPPVMLGIEMLADEADLKKLSPGSQIFLPSYSAHYDRSSERPVMRGGIVSSDPESDYQAEGQPPARRVLFQAHSAEGASGGPVFALMQDMTVLLGVNAGHLTGDEPKIGTIHSGFSYCFKASCIREAVNELLASPDGAEGPETAGLV